MWYHVLLSVGDACSSRGSSRPTDLVIAIPDRELIFILINTFPDPFAWRRLELRCSITHIWALYIQALHQHRQHFILAIHRPPQRLDLLVKDLYVGFCYTTTDLTK